MIAYPKPHFNTCGSLEVINSTMYVKTCTKSSLEGGAPHPIFSSLNKFDQRKHFHIKLKTNMTAGMVSKSA